MTRLGTGSQQGQTLDVTLTQQDNPIWTRFKALSEAENEAQIQNTLADLPESALRAKAVKILGIE